MAMIHFKLEELDQIPSFSDSQGSKSLSWFGLTYGDLWLQFGDNTIYEYSQEAIDYRGGKSTPYNDYQLARFIEDFTELFPRIRETVPEEFYYLTKNLEKFQTNVKERIDRCDLEFEEDSDSVFNEYNKLAYRTYERTFDSGHLIGGPRLSFFRNNDKIRIVRKTEYTLEDDIKIWTAKNGSYEMGYQDFIDEIKRFGKSFFTEMDKQIAGALAKEWGDIKVDKERLMKEHKERKEAFYSHLHLLEEEEKTETSTTDRKRIKELLDKMTTEMK